MTGHDAFQDAPAPYALGALDQEERLAFEAHLASCPICQDEVAQFRRVAAALGASTDAVNPPASLKARTLQRATSQASHPVRVDRPALGAVASPWRWLSIAAAMVLAAGLGVYAWSLKAEVRLLRAMVAESTARADALRQEVTALRRDAVRLTNTVNILSAPDLIRVDLKGLAGAPGATGRAYLSRTHGFIVAAAGLPALPSGRVYQVWAIPANAPPVSAGLLQTDAAGASAFAPTIPVAMDALRTVAVTDEPGPNGSPGPTSTPLLAGSVGG